MQFKVFDKQANNTKIKLGADLYWSRKLFLFFFFLSIRQQCLTIPGGREASSVQCQDRLSRCQVQSPSFSSKSFTVWWKIPSDKDEHKRHLQVVINWGNSTLHQVSAIYTLKAFCWNVSKTNSIHLKLRTAYQLTFYIHNERHLLPSRRLRWSIRQKSNVPDCWPNFPRVVFTSSRGNATAARRRTSACWRGNWWPCWRTQTRWAAAAAGWFIPEASLCSRLPIKSQGRQDNQKAIQKKKKRVSLILGCIYHLCWPLSTHFSADWPEFGRKLKKKKSPGALETFAASFILSSRGRVTL